MRISQTPKLVLCLLLCYCLKGHSESRRDSLNRIVASYSQPTEKVDIMNKISYEIKYIDPKISSEYARKAVRLSKSIDYRYGLANASRLYGSMLYRQGISDSSRFYINQAKNIALEEDFKEILSSAYANLGLIYYSNNDNQKAFELLNQALELQLEIDDKEKIYKTYNNIATLHAAMSNYPEALEYFFESLKLSSYVKDSTLVSKTYNNIGHIYLTMKEYDNALKYMFKGLKESEGAEEQNFRATQLFNIGDVYVELKNYDKALKYYHQSIKSVFTDNPCTASYAYGSIVNVLLTTNQPDSALFHARKALDLSKKCGFGSTHTWNNLFMARSFLALNRLDSASYYLKKLKTDLNQNKDFQKGNSYKLYLIAQKDYFQKIGNYKEALSFMSDLKEYEDSVFSEKNLIQIAQLESRFKFEKEKEILLANQASESLLLEEKVHSYRRSRNYIIIGSIFLLILAYILYRSYNKQKRAKNVMEEKNRLISLQKKELMARTDQLKSSNEQIKKLSNFKEGLAHMAVHDMKNPLNTIMGLSLGSASDKKLRIINKASVQMFNFITNMLDIYKFEQAEVKLNLKNYNLRSIISDAEAQVKFLLQEKYLEVKKQIELNLETVVDGEMLGRVIVNLLTNAIKYSNADDKIVVSCNKVKEDGVDLLRLTVKDFGEGIPKEQLPLLFDKFNRNKKQTVSKSSSTGIGLSFCQLAVEAHNGTIEARSELGKGSTFIITLPYITDEEIHTSPETGPVELSSKTEDISASEIAYIKEFASRLVGFRVHEVSKINSILMEMEERNIKSPWREKIQLAVYTGDQDKFEELMNEIN